MHFRCVLGDIRFVRGGRVRLGAPWKASVLLGFIGVSSGTFNVAGYIWVRRGGRPVRSGWLGSLGCALGVIGFARDFWVNCKVQ